MNGYSLCVCVSMCEGMCGAYMCVWCASMCVPCMHGVFMVLCMGMGSGGTCLCISTHENVHVTVWHAGEDYGNPRAFSIRILTFCLGEPLLMITTLICDFEWGRG